MSGKKTGRKILLTLVIILALIVAALCFLPTILSLASVRRSILGQVEKRTGASLTIADWSFGWLGKQEISGIKFADPNKHMTVEVQRVTVPAGILSLLGSSRDLGNIEVVRPAIDMELPSPAEAAPAGKPAPAKKKAPASQPALKPIIPGDIKGKLVISEGSVVIRNPAAGRESRVGALNVTLDISSLNQPLRFHMEAILDNGGKFETDGSATILKNGMPDPNALLADCTVRLNRFPLASINAFVQAPGVLPDISGFLSSDISVKVEGTNKLGCTGVVSVDALAMAGGVLGKDSPSFDKISLEFVINKIGNELKIGKLQLKSPVAAVAASGDLSLPSGGGLPQGAFACTARVDIASVAVRFPNSLKLRPGLTIRKGTLDFGGEMASSPDGQKYGGKMKLSDISATLNGRQVEPMEPLELTANAAMDNNGFRLDGFKLTSSFLQGSGSGTMNEMNLTVSGDLSRALAEAGKFAALEKISLGGRLSMEAHLESPAKDRKAVSASISIQDLLFSPGNAGPRIGDKLIEAQVASTLIMGADGKPQGLTATRANLKSSFAQAALRVDSVALPAGGAPAAKGISVDATADLSKAIECSGTAAKLPPGLAVAGAVHVVLAADFADSVVSLASADLTGAGLVVEKNGKRLAPTDILVKAKNGDINLQQCSASLASVGIVLPAGRIDVSKVALPDWRQAPAGASLIVDGRLDIAKLAAMLGGFLPLKEGTTVAGGLSASAEITPGTAGEDAKIAMSVTDLKLKSATSELPAQNIQLAAAATIDAKACSVKLDSVTLASGPASLKCSGAVKDWRLAPAGTTLHADGNVDIAGVLALVRNFAPIPSDLSVEGTVAAGADLSAGAAGEDIKASASVTGLKIRSKGAEIKEEKVDLAAIAAIDAKAGNMTLQSLTLASSPVSLNCAGSLKDFRNAKLLNMKGDIAPDLGRIAEIVRTLTGTDIAMTGKGTQPFDINTSLKGKWTEMLNSTKMSAGLYASRIEFLGVNVSELGVPMSVAGGKAQVKINAAMNEGKLAAAPFVDAAATTPALMLPDNSQLLTDVKLNSDMCNKLLARIHPVFKGCAVSDGKMSLSMKKLTAPLNKNWQQSTYFEGAVFFKGLTVGPGGLLQEVMGLMGGVGKKMAIGDQSFTFVCRNGRIYPSPLTVKSGTNSIVFSGSVGLDQTLEYYADVPVPAEMGKDVNKYVQGESIRVPIGGTVKSPRLDKAAFLAAQAELIKKAGTRVIKEEAGKLLEENAGKLLDGLFKKK